MLIQSIQEKHKFARGHFIKASFFIAIMLCVSFPLTGNTQDRDKNKRKQTQNSDQLREHRSDRSDAKGDDVRQGQQQNRAQRQAEDHRKAGQDRGSKARSAKARAAKARAAKQKSGKKRKGSASGRKAQERTDRPDKKNVEHNSNQLSDGIRQILREHGIDMKDANIEIDVIVNQSDKGATKVRMDISKGKDDQASREKKNVEQNVERRVEVRRRVESNDQDREMPRSAVRQPSDRRPAVQQTARPQSDRPHADRRMIDQSGNQQIDRLPTRVRVTQDQRARDPDSAGRPPENNSVENSRRIDRLERAFRDVERKLQEVLEKLGNK